LIIDLFCGIGRFETNKCEVISIDINPITKPDILADIRYLPLREKLKPELVHASPPCKYFSIARQRRKGLNEKGIAESLELVASCFHAFAYLETKNWTLENPIGFLERIFTKRKIKYKAYDYTEKYTNFWSNMKTLKRSIIPKEIRQIILKEVFRDEEI